MSRSSLRVLFSAVLFSAAMLASTVGQVLASGNNGPFPR
jgi:hypothetical protein